MQTTRAVHSSSHSRATASTTASHWVARDSRHRSSSSSRSSGRDRRRRGKNKMLHRISELEAQLVAKDQCIGVLHAIIAEIASSTLCVPLEPTPQHQVHSSPELFDMFGDRDAAIPDLTLTHVATQTDISVDLTSPDVFVSSLDLPPCLTTVAALPDKGGVAQHLEHGDSGDAAAGASSSHDRGHHHSASLPKADVQLDAPRGGELINMPPTPTWHAGTVCASESNTEHLICETLDGSADFTSTPLRTSTQTQCGHLDIHSDSEVSGGTQSVDTDAALIFDSQSHASQNDAADLDTAVKDSNSQIDHALKDFNSQALALQCEATNKVVTFALESSSQGFAKTSVSVAADLVTQCGPSLHDGSENVRDFECTLDRILTVLAKRKKQTQAAIHGAARGIRFAATQNAVDVATYSDRIRGSSNLLWAAVFEAT